MAYTPQETIDNLVNLLEHSINSEIKALQENRELRNEVDRLKSALNSQTDFADKYLIGYEYEDTEPEQTKPKGRIVEFIQKAM